MVNKAAAKLRAQIAEEGNIVVCPGVQDGLSARVCLDEGFKNLYMVSPLTLFFTGLNTFPYPEVL